MALASAQPVDGDGEIAVAESLPGSYHGLRPIMHPAHPVYAEASAFSDDQYGLYLLRKEWFSVMLALDMADGEILENDHTPTMFHGTEWGAAFQIVCNRAFIIGPGTHGIRGRSMAGCWCVPTLPDALHRCSLRDSWIANVVTRVGVAQLCCSSGLRGLSAFPAALCIALQEVRLVRFTTGW